ncbi:MAG TPA: class I SAM-dependent methyltransferase [Gemmatimonadaceae bacterium]
MSHRVAPPSPSEPDSGIVRRPSIRVRHAQDAYRAFDNWETRNGLQERLEIPLLLRALCPPRGQRVLEIGCGRGVALPVLAARLQPAALTAVDIDAELVNLARERVVRSHVRATVVEADARALPFDDGEFDLVIDFGTCYHVGGGRHGSAVALHEIARVLSVGGRFIHETPIAQHLAHPIRSLGRTLPWRRVPSLVWEASAVLWSMRRRVA